MNKTPDGKEPLPGEAGAAKPAGFTILELLVAMTVLAILVVMLMGMVDSATKLWRENEKRVDAYREARAALNMISSDLRSMLATTNTNYFSTNIVGGSSGGVITTEGCLFFLTALPPSAQAATDRSDLCTVGYFRGWSKQNVNFPITAGNADLTKEGFQLFRTLYRSGTTYSNLIDPSKKPLENLATIGADSEIVARNVLDLEFRCYETNTTNTLPFRPWTWSTNNPLPQMIEVRLTAVSDDLAKKLQGNSNRWTTDDAAVTNDMRTFVTRVQVPGVVTN